jgi:hypothetical protein
VVRGGGETSQGHILVKSDSDHEKEKTVDEGQYYLAGFEDDPEFQGMPHLFLKDTKNRYKEFVLPKGLLTEGNDRKKVLLTDEKVKLNIPIHTAQGIPCPTKRQKFPKSITGFLGLVPPV